MVVPPEPEGELATTAPHHQFMRLARQLAQATNTAAIMSAVTAALRQMIGADGATFVLRSGAECHYAEEDAISPLWRGRKFPMSACISGWCIEQGETVAVPDVFADARVPADAYRPTFVRSLAMAPVRLDTPIGALGAYWQRHHVASRHELDLLEAVADVTALALGRTQLAEAQLAATQARTAAERALAIKSRVLGNVSHEIRQPVQAARLFLEVLMSRPDHADRHTVIRKTTAALSEAERILGCMLHMARLDAGLVVLQPRSFDTACVIDESAAGYRERARREGTTLKVVRSSLEVMGDPAAIRVILEALIDNALRFARRGRVLVGCRRRGRDVTIEVIDNGCGIPQADQPFIFEDFWRATDDQESGQARSLGVGLPLAQRLASLSGARLEFQSRPGTGTSFRVVLPQKEH